MTQKINKTLTPSERVILSYLLKRGTTLRSAYKEEEIVSLIERHLIRSLPPNRIGITTLGTEALIPSTAEDNHAADRRASYRQEAFSPLTDSARRLLAALFEAGGTLKQGDFDGRTAHALIKQGLAERSEDGFTLTITPAGEKRSPARSAVPASTSVRPPPAAPIRRPDPPPLPAAPSTLGETLAITPEPEPEERRAIRVTVTVEGMDEAHFKARVLDMLVATSPSVAEFYDSVRKAEDAAGRLKGV